MIKYLLFILVLLYAAPYLTAQEEDCNDLGVWLWRFEQTGQPSHANLARTLSFMGAQRIYIKVADGGVDAVDWPTIEDEALIEEYLEEGIIPWAWSYNYQGNYAEQAKALYLAAKTGYQGFVIDIEIEFNGEDQELENLMQAFFIEKQRAIVDGHADQDFALYVTTWGNPSFHNYRIDIIDKYVDGYMPQTYIEEWAGDHLTMIDACIEESRLDYQSLGATKPLHNIVSTAQQILTAEEITHFFQQSGPEASLWRVPGGGVSQQVWSIWNDVDWDINFCDQVSTSKNASKSELNVFPNPVSDFLTIETNVDITFEKIELYRQDGALVKQFSEGSTRLNVGDLSAGVYHLILYQPNTTLHQRFLKL